MVEAACLRQTRDDQILKHPHPELVHHQNAAIVGPYLLRIAILRMFSREMARDYLIPISAIRSKILVPGLIKGASYVNAILVEFPVAINSKNLRVSFGVASRVLKSANCVSESH